MVLPGPGREGYVNTPCPPACTKSPLYSDTFAGGANPAIRTLFYRLLRLLSLTIAPIFVFDGPNKPAFKRHRRSRGPGDSVSIAMAKRMIRLFGFAIHDAPGEAEAECALLQREGVVDAVLSEDVDTIMFGCSRTLRNWSAEGPRAAKTPTHVSVYDIAELKQGETGLDREGMVLVALMSGGDYIPEGVPGCGVKVACEAAKAGFGRRLCRIKRSDPEALREWREVLMRELRTNESNFFRVKHKALTIPEEFPNMEVLRYYTHPVVSQAASIERLRRQFPSKKDIDIVGLRAFTAETFDWTYKVGAIKFIRVFAPSLLVQALMDLSHQEVDSDDPDIREETESKLVEAIRARRIHFSTDATPELRVSYVPNDIVGLDLDAEEDEVESTYGRSGLALNSDDEAGENPEDGEGEPRSGPKKVFNPLQLDLAWVPESAAKLGVPLMVEDWEEKQRAKQLVKQKRAPATRERKKIPDMPAGALDKYIKSTKPVRAASTKVSEGLTIALSASQPPPTVPPLFQQCRAKNMASGSRDIEVDPSAPTRTNSPKVSRRSKTKPNASVSTPSLEVNPWSIASSQSTPKGSKAASIDDTNHLPQPIFISSSPIAASCPPRSTVPAVVCSNSGLDAPPSALLPIDDNTKALPASNEPRSPPSCIESTAGALISPRKHNRPSEETIGKPAAKRPQKYGSRAATRDGSPTRRSTRPGGASQKPTTQPSIKSFGRLSEALGKRGMAPCVAKPSDPRPDTDGDDEDDDDDEEEFEDMRTLGSKKPPPPPSSSSSSSPKTGARAAATGFPAPFQRSHLSLLKDKDKDAQNSTARPTPTKISAIIELPSSPPAPSPFRPAAASRSKTTRLYIPRTSDAGLGYFREVEVTREEADRRIREESEALRKSQRPGGRRMWRESEVTILDLTGED